MFGLQLLIVSFLLNELVPTQACITSLGIVYGVLNICTTFGYKSCCQFNSPDTLPVQS